MKPGKILKVFKKGSRAASSRGKKKADRPTQWPSGLRLGIYGHANSGKTVYFTVLHEECKISRELHLSVIDHGTATEFLKHYREIWGLSTAQDAGTVMDVRGEKRFPDPTKGDRLLLFNATLDGSKKVAVVAYDYDGKAVAISDAGDLKDRVADFMSGCDGILFFYDPKLLGAEIENQAHVASFIHMIEELAPLGSPLPIPVALVVTKADILPGFAGDNQTVLIPPEDEHFLSQGFEIFLERVLSSNRIADDPAWAGTVREILVRLREFLKVVVGRTLDFQVFFTSATGRTPEKVGTEVGRSIYTPPNKITPIGIKEPVYWLLRAVIRNRRFLRMKSLSRFVAVLTLIWLVLFSAPCLYHFKYLLPRLDNVENSILTAYQGSMLNITKGERRRIIEAYRRYENKWVVRQLFSSFLAPSGRIRNLYVEFNIADAEKRLDEVIDRFTSIVSDTLLWPHVNPSDSSLIETEQHRRLVEELSSYHRGDSTSILYTRSGRVLQYWELFSRSIRYPGDTTYWNVIKQQVQQDQALYSKEISGAEKKLGEALKAREIKKVQKVIATQTAFQFDEQLVDQVNGNADPGYRLDAAVKKLRGMLSKLDPSDSGHRNMIQRYLDDAGKWYRPRKYKCKIETLPRGAHLHIEVTDAGKDPNWADVNQIFEGDELTLRWKLGQDIHIALDTVGYCQWGKQPSDKVILKGKYSLFEIEKGLSFDNVGMKVGIRCIPGLGEQLPVLK